jgi:hypothetical protein
VRSQLNARTLGLQRSAMAISKTRGYCSHCASDFLYRLIHNGFNDSAYAYCDVCGCTALLSGWATDIPVEAGLVIHARITPSVEPFLRRCSCGGRFTSRAAPRCPHCQFELSAGDATSFLEANAPGTDVGWRWQCSWDGLYCIIIGDRVTYDPWAHRPVLTGACALTRRCS